MGTRSGAYELNHEFASQKEYLYALVVWKAYVDRMLFGWLFLGIPNKFLPDAYLTDSILASGSMNVFRYF